MNMAPQDQDPRNLHDLAVDVQTDTQKLATGLAHAGAAPAAVAQLTKMAEIVGQVVKVLSQGPVGSEGQPGPAHPVPGQEQPAPQQQAAAPQPAPPAAAPPQQAQQHSLHSAAHSLHAAMIASAAARRP